jgi:hypothetical protein
MRQIYSTGEDADEQIKLVSPESDDEEPFRNSRDFKVAFEQCSAEGCDDEPTAQSVCEVRIAEIKRQDLFLKPLLKRVSSLKNGRLRHTSNKRVRWADTELQQERTRRLRYANPTEPAIHYWGLACADPVQYSSDLLRFLNPECSCCG